jgi:lambda family phage portal protein
MGDLQQFKADYQLAGESRFRRQRMGLGGTGDAHLTQAQFWKIREYCRDADRNDSIVGQMADRMCDNVVGEGLECEPMTPDPELNKAIKLRFWAWATDKAQCCARRMFTFGMQQRLVLRSEFFDGDIFAMPVSNDARIQLVEGDRCLTPSNSKLKVVHGIRLGDLAEPLEFWFTKIKRRDAHLEAVGDVDKYAAYDDEGFAQIWHCLDPKRSSQSRGVPALKAVFDYLTMLEDVNFAKLVQSQVVSCIGLFLERSNEFKGSVDLTLGSRSTEQNDDSTTATLEKMKPGLIIKGRKGEKPTSLTNNVPNAEYFDHVHLILRIIGAAAGMPLSLVLLDTSDTTFHGYRGELNEARKGFRRSRMRLACNFCGPVYRWKVRQWFREGLLKSPKAAQFAKDGSLYWHKWIGEGWPYVDPEKDSQADVVLKDNWLESPRQIQARKGHDYDEMVDETIEDNGSLILKACLKAKEISTATKENITWRDIISPLGEIKTAQILPAGGKPGSNPAQSPKNGNGNGQHVNRLEEVTV